MAKKKNNKKNKNTSKHAGAGKQRRAAKYHQSEGTLATNCAASTPGIMMLAMLAVLFLCELLGRVDTTGQISLYQVTFRVFDYITIVVGIIFLIYQGTRGNLNIGLKSLFPPAKAGMSGDPAPRRTITVDGWIELFFGLFLLCVIVSTCINGLNHDSAFGIAVRYIGIFNVFAFFIIYMKVSEYIDMDRFRHIILVSYLAIADIVTISALWNKFIGPVPAYQNKDGISAIFVQFNHFGYFLAMAIVIGIGYWVYEKGKLSIIGAASALLNLIMLAFNNTLGAELAVGACVAGMTIVIVIFDRDNKPVLRKMLGTMAFFIVCVLGALAVIPEVRASVTTLLSDMGNILSGHTTGHEGTERMMLWQHGVDYVKANPLFGRGCEGVTMEMKESLGHGDVHSEPLTYAIYYGLPAALFYLAGVVMVAVRYFKTRKSLPVTCRIPFLAACAYLLSSFVGVAIFYTAPFFFIFMGMSASTRGKQNSKPN